jgi:hypothetical protein
MTIWVIFGVIEAPHNLRKIDQQHPNIQIECYAYNLVNER